MSTAPPLHAIPTNIITGFLGVGKTTAILHLLRHKPAQQRWAVLVNEFGEVGIDGSIMAGANTDQGGLFIRELPGGCMCCATGLPLQISLNRLLQQARPHRLLIEPTGLGHPEEIIALLRSDLYAQVLDLRATITLMDARALTDPRYITNPTFVQQLQVADFIVANKSETYSPEDRSRLEHSLADWFPGRPFGYATHGQFELDRLDRPSAYPIAKRRDYAPASPFTVDLPEPLPACGYIHKSRTAEGYISSGWIFDPDFIFDYSAVLALLSGAAEARLKGVFITERGIYAFNKNGEVLTETELDDAEDTRFEIIHTQPLDASHWQSQLLAACQLQGKPAG